DLDDVAVGQRVLLDAAGVDENAVGAVQVLDDRTAALGNDLRVMARDELAADLNVVVRRPADDRAARPQREMSDELVLEEQIHACRVPGARRRELACRAGRSIPFPFPLTLTHALRILDPLQL